MTYERFTWLVRVRERLERQSVDLIFRSGNVVTAEAIPLSARIGRVISWAGQDAWDAAGEVLGYPPKQKRPQHASAEV